MSRIVRSSKYRHVFGTVAKKEECYDELKITRNSGDSNFISASATYFAVCLEAAGGGAFAVIDYKNVGKFNPNAPIVNGHKAAVIDLDFNPFNDSMIASGSEDCTAKIWTIPQSGLTENLSNPSQTLTGHKRKLLNVKFHPVANNVLATSSTDFSVKVWDIEKGNTICSLEAQHSDLIGCVEWKYNGSLIATSCKDKKVRIFDPRTNSISADVEAHQGNKVFRVSWLGRRDNLFSVGFTKTSEREYAIWDPRNISSPLVRQNLDSASGLIMPFFDIDTNVLFLGGKGDGNIRYYEIVDEAPYIHFLSEFKTNVPTRGLCLVPKRALKINECEIARFLKISVKMCEPISFQVPRKSDVFQDDIFPPCFSGDPSLTVAEYMSGKNAEPKTVSLSIGFVAKPKVTEFVPEVKEEKVWTEKELKDEVEKLTKRVAYLETELVKRDNKIKELEASK
jgi:coronin-1B/1C/6